MSNGWADAAIAACERMDYHHNLVAVAAHELETDPHATEDEWIEHALDFLRAVNVEVDAAGRQGLSDYPAWAAFMATEWVAKEYLDIEDIWEFLPSLLRVYNEDFELADSSLQLIVSHMIRAGQQGIWHSNSRPDVVLVAWIKHEQNFLYETSDAQAELYDVVADLRRGGSPLRPVPGAAPRPSVAPAYVHSAACGAAVLEVEFCLHACDTTRPGSDDRVRTAAAALEAAIRHVAVFRESPSFPRLFAVLICKFVEFATNAHRFEQLTGVQTLQAMLTSLLLAVFGLHLPAFRRVVLAKGHEVWQLLSANGQHLPPREKFDANGLLEELTALNQHMRQMHGSAGEHDPTLWSIGINDKHEVHDPADFIELRSGLRRRQPPTVVEHPDATDDVIGYWGLRQMDAENTGFFGGGRPELAGGDDPWTVVAPPNSDEEDDDVEEYSDDDGRDSEDEWGRF